MTFIAIFHFVPPKKVIIFNRCKFYNKMLLNIYFIEKTDYFDRLSRTKLHLCRVKAVPCRGAAQLAELNVQSLV